MQDEVFSCIKRARSYEDGLARWNKLTRKIIPGEDIARATAIASGPRIANDLQKLSRWLQQLMKKEPAPASVVAWYFGLFESDGGTQLYLCGTEEYDADPDEGDWAFDPVYFPEGRYAPRTLLNEMGSLADANVREYASLLHAGLMVRALCSVHGEAMASTASRPVAVGWDDGDPPVTLGCIPKRRR